MGMRRDINELVGVDRNMASNIEQLEKSSHQFGFGGGKVRNMWRSTLTQEDNTMDVESRDVWEEGPGY